MDSSKLIERGGLVYHLKPNSLFHGKGVKISDTPFNGKAVKHYSSGEVQIKATYKDGISIQFSYLGIDGTVLESSEIIGDTTIESNWNINGQKYFERRTIGGTIISVKRWYEDGTIRQEPFDWEKKTEEIKQGNDMAIFMTASRFQLSWTIYWVGIERSISLLRSTP